MARPNITEADIRELPYTFLVNLYQSTKNKKIKKWCLAEIKRRRGNRGF